MSEFALFRITVVGITASFFTKDRFIVIMFVIVGMVACSGLFVVGASSFQVTVAGYHLREGVLFEQGDILRDTCGFSFQNLETDRVHQAHRDIADTVGNDAVQL